LSSVPQNVCAPILDRAMRSNCERPAQKRWTRPAVEEALNLFRRRGFADFYWLCRHTNMVGLSVPVQIDAERSAALTVRFAESAVPVKEAMAKFLPVLRTVAAKVSLQTGAPEPKVLQEPRSALHSMKVQIAPNNASALSLSIRCFCTSLTSWRARNFRCTNIESSTSPGWP
jgi:hypothetical protein